MYTINLITHNIPKTSSRESFEIALAKDLAFMQNHYKIPVLGFEVINCGLTYLTDPYGTTSCTISSEIKVNFASSPRVANAENFRINTCSKDINNKKHLSHAPISYAPGCNINAILREFA